MLICKACGQECREIVVDYGIGFYDYWGATGWDSRRDYVSDCCEATIVVDYGPDEPAECITEADMEVAR